MNESASTRPRAAQVLLERAAMMKLKKRRRAPFVISIALAAGAVGAGCGGKTDGSGGDSGAGGTGGTGATGGTSGVGGNPPMPTCPIAAPVDGTGCAIPSFQTCSYPGTAPCNGTTYAQCNSGTWSVWMDAVGCNPPPPIETCPASEPVVGTWCNVPATEVCYYADECCGAQYQCVGNTWTDTLGYECNPPPPVCPVEPPAQGAACVPEPCSTWPCYWDQCFDGPGYVSASCNGGAWNVTITPCK